MSATQASYGLTKSLGTIEFDQAITKVTEALATQGFGVAVDHHRRHVAAEAHQLHQVRHVEGTFAEQADHGRRMEVARSGPLHLGCQLAARHDLDVQVAAPEPAPDRAPLVALTIEEEHR